MLPILLSIPHGGTEVPDELRDRLCITPHDLFDDSDPFTTDIYDLGGDVARVVKATYARAFVDLNRAPGDWPPRHPDGVVKTATCFNRPIYRPGHEPDPTLTDQLLKRYYEPYHTQLTEAAAHPCVRLALDCHSMLSHAPPIASDPGRARPLFCLGNRDGATASRVLLDELAEALCAAFEISREDIGLNDPFKGGHITQTHGGGRLPWIQVEMNRSWYLDVPWFSRPTLHVDPLRIVELRDRFRRALRRMRFD